MTRPRTPTAVLEARGAFKKHPERRKDRANEPAVVDGVPECPADLDKIARAEWNRVTQIMTEMSTLNLETRPILETYCQTFSQWKHACQCLEREGAVIDGKRNPNLTLLNQSRQALIKLLVELGLTPSSRSRVAVKPQQSIDPMAALIARRIG